MSAAFAGVWVFSGPPFPCIKNKILLHFSDLIRLIQQFINQAASPPADGKGLQGAAQNERFSRPKAVGQGSYSSQECLGVSRSLSFRGWQGSVRRMTSPE